MEGDIQFEGHLEYNDDPMMHEQGPEVDNHDHEERGAMHGLMDHELMDKLGPEDEEELRNIDNSYNGYSLKQWNGHADHPSGDDHDHGMMGMDSLHDHAEVQYSDPHSPDYAERSGNNYYFDDSNMNLSLGDVGRMNRMAQAEEAIRQEMFKDCTFRPSIKALPNSYGAMKDNGTSFLQRANKWTKEREAELKKKYDAMQRNELADCTFTPKLSKNSQRTVREMRGSTREDFADRLYKGSNLLTEQRYKLIEHERAKEQQNEKLQCTFQPQLITKSFNASVSSKVFREKKNQRQPEKEENSKSDQFQPKINKIKPHMQSAKAYCSTNVVERLSRPVQQIQSSGGATNAQVSRSQSNNQANNDGEAGRIMDVNAFMSKKDATQPFNSVPQTVFTSPSFSINTYNRVDVNDDNRKDDKVSSAEEAKARKLKFEQFLKRQQNNLKTKNLSVKLLETATKPSFQPKFCKKSMELVDKRFNNTDFINRLERDLLKRVSNEEGVSRIAHEALKEETFKPHINRKSEMMPSRTPYDMSRGDMFRKETSSRLSKLQQEQESMEIVTFKPKIFTSKSQHKPSKLGLNNDPSQFLEKYKENLMEQKNISEQEKKRREDEELAECSFAPKTVECPEYVKRIAKSMAIVKAAKSSQVPLNEKPDWR